MHDKKWQDPEKGVFGEQAFLQAFGRQVRGLRQERGLTQAELAEKAEVGMKYVGEIEWSKTNPTVRLVWRLGEALGVDVFEFFLFPSTNKDKDARVRVRLLHLLKDRKEGRRLRGLRKIDFTVRWECGRVAAWPTAHTRNCG